MSSDSDPPKDPKSRLHSFRALRDAFGGGLLSGPAPAAPRASNERLAAWLAERGFAGVVRGN